MTSLMDRSAVLMFLFIQRLFSVINKDQQNRDFSTSHHRNHKLCSKWFGIKVSSC